MRDLGKKQLVLHLQAPLAEVPTHLVDYRLELSEDLMDLTYTYDTKQNSTGITALLGDLRGADIHFNDLQTSQSSLEDIFVDLVHRDQ
jgi:ABC-2 type transport system ATP-binding protein